MWITQRLVPSLFIDILIQLSSKLSLNVLNVLINATVPTYTGEKAEAQRG